MSNPYSHSTKYRILQGKANRLCRKTPSSARERAVLLPGNDGEAGDIGFIVDGAGSGQAIKGPPEARSGLSTEPNVVQHFLTLCLLCAFAGTAVFAQETSARPGWTLYWSDEFDGDSLDESVWSLEQLDPPHNEELQFYTHTHGQKDSNIWVKGGLLVIEARKQKATGRRREYAYTSGRIITQGKKEFQYGRMEARIKLPSGNGIWPAFWMLGNTMQTEGWPRAGEIDIMEAKGRLPHYASAAIHRGPRGRNKIFSRTYTLEGKSFFDDFHIFAIEWDERQIKWFVDKDNFMTAKKADETDPVYWPFDKPFFFILNVAVGGWFDKGEDNTNQIPKAGDLPTRMLVDYVRVYKPGE